MNNALLREEVLTKSTELHLINTILMQEICLSAFAALPVTHAATAIALENSRAVFNALLEQAINSYTPVQIPHALIATANTAQAHQKTAQVLLVQSFDTMTRLIAILKNPPKFVGKLECFYDNFVDINTQAMIAAQNLKEILVNIQAKVKSNSIFISLPSLAVDAFITQADIYMTSISRLQQMQTPLALVNLEVHSMLKQALNIENSAVNAHILPITHDFLSRQNIQ